MTDMNAKGFFIFQNVSKALGLAGRIGVVSPTALLNTSRVSNDVCKMYRYAGYMNYEFYDYMYGKFAQIHLIAK